MELDVDNRRLALSHKHLEENLGIRSKPYSPEVLYTSVPSFLKMTEVVC